MTSKIMDWLNQNRYRSFPMVRDEWRSKVSSESGLDKVLVDAMVFDADFSGHKSLSLVKVSKDDLSTRVFFEYGESEFDVVLTGGTQSGAQSYEMIHVSVPTGNSRPAMVSLAFSSHEYLKISLPNGEWTIGCSVLPSRIIGLSNGFGVDRIHVNGSKGVNGHNTSADASGEVVLEDGFRTSPVIQDGNIVVRVGRRYGFDPCKHDFGDEGSRDCSKPLFFLCGQNAVNSGDVVIKGGPGISVTQGRNYVVKSGRCAGMSIPAIEIIADRSLMDIYSPDV